MQGSNYQVDKEPLLDLPIYNAPVNGQEHVIKLVDQIRNNIINSHAEVINMYERQINFLAYKIYGLTENEVEIIEGLQ